MTDDQIELCIQGLKGMQATFSVAQLDAAEKFIADARQALAELEDMKRDRRDREPKPGH